MTETQTDFFQRLCAPFEANELSFRVENGRTMVYVKPRRLQNRLDDVAGVDGWRPQYRRTPLGFTCRLSIRIPSADDNEPWTWFWKEDGAGTEGMTKKRDGQTVPDTDNDEKSGYTNAFRRACTAWGMTRYLYREGVPEYLGEEPEIPEPPPEVQRGQGSYQSNRARPPAGGQAAGPGRGGSAPWQESAARPEGQGQGTRFNLPRSGKALFAWAKNMETHFHFSVVKPLNDMLKQAGHDRRLIEVDPDTAENLAREMVEVHIKHWPNYGGEFDHLGATSANP